MAYNFGTSVDMVRGGAGGGLRELWGSDAAYARLVGTGFALGVAQDTAPSDNTQLWADTSTGLLGPATWKRWDGTMWSAAMTDQSAAALAHAHAHAGIAVLSLKRFGGKGAGAASATPDQLAYLRAIRVANARGGYCTIHIPSGDWHLGTGSGTVIDAPWVTIRGEGSSTKITMTGGTFGFWQRNAGVGIDTGGGMSDLLVTGPAVVAVIRNMSQMILKNVSYSAVNSLAYVGDATRPVYGLTISNCNGYKLNVEGVPLILLNRGAGLFVENVKAFTEVGVPIHPANAPATGAPWAANCNVLTSLYAWDTIIMSNCLFERFSAGIVLVPLAGNAVQNVSVTNTYLDYFDKAVLYIEPAATALVANVHMSRCWGVTWNDHVLYFNATLGAVLDITFNDCIFPMSGKRAAYISGPCREIEFASVKFSACNRLATEAAALVVPAGASVTFVVGMLNTNSSAGWGFNVQCAYALSVESDADEYAFTDLKLGGTTAAYAIGLNASATKKRRIGNNRLDGVIDFGVGHAELQSSFGVPASDATTYNKTPFTVIIAPTSGSLGAATKNGRATLLPITLTPGEYFTLGYTTVPQFNYSAIH